MRRRRLSWAHTKALSVGRGRYWRAHLKGRRSIDPQTPVRGGDRDLVSFVSVNWAEAMGFEFKRAIWELESACGFGPEIGGNAFDDVEDQHDVPKPELCRITI